MTIDTNKKYKIYPSSSGFAQGHRIITKYESGCLRYILVAPHAKRSDIDPAFAKVGALHEDWYAEKMGSGIMHRELPIKVELAPNIEYSGRVDFITHDGVIHETKASFSKNFKSSVINQGRVEPSHLAQIISYMIQREQDLGRIIAGYYEEASDGRIVQKAVREFDIAIGDGGKILVDGVATEYTVADQLSHLMAVLRVLRDRYIAQRPALHDDKFKSPCKYCPLSDTCNMFDDGEILEVDDFITIGVEAINKKPPLKAKINKEAVRGKRRNSKNT